MSSYVDFINSMLKLRDQKLREEEDQQAQQDAMMKQMLGVSSSIGSSLVKAQQQSTRDTLANQMRNYAEPPRATAVTPGTTTYDPAINKAAAASPLAGQISYGDIPVTTRPATGGEAELDMRLKMDAEARRRMDATINANQDERRIAISQGHLDLAQQQAAGLTPAQQDAAARAAENQKAIAARAAEDDRRAESQKRVDDAKAADAASSDKYKEAKANAKAYNTNTAVVLDAIKNAPDQKTYIDALRQLDDHFVAADSLGLKVEKPAIPSWEETVAAKAKEEAIKTATAGGPLDWNPFNNPAYRAQAPGLQKELEAMPGYGYTKPGSRNVPLVEGGYSATPAMPQPTPQDYGAIRAGTPAVPSTQATPSAASAPTMSAAEYKAKTGEDVAPGTVKVDAKGRRLLITP